MSLRDQLQTIYDQHGQLTPELVVQAARPKNHPLHAWVFNKTAKEAAEAYFRERAHELIQSVRVVYREANEHGPAKHVRAFHCVLSETGPVYEPVEKIAEDRFARRLVLQSMEREWKDLFRKYEDFEEFLGMVKADVEEVAA